MNTLALFGMQGPWEIILILLIVLLLFGSKKLPELARSLGKSLNEFKRGQAESPPEKDEEKPAPESEQPSEDPKADA